MMAGRRAAALLFALGVQAGIALLLLLSFTVIRLVAPEKETILYLPRLKPEAKIIDAHRPPQPRALPPSPAAPPAAPPPLPAYAMPGPALPGAAGSGSTLLQALGRNLANCRIEDMGRREAAARCPPSGLTPPDQRIVKLDDRQVKNAPMWQGEVDRRNAPFALPGAGAGPLGILVTALLNPSAFSDPKAYSAVPAPAERISGAEALQQRRYNNPNTSLTGTDYENRVRRDGAGSAMHVDFK